MHLLFPYGKNGFSHDMALTITVLSGNLLPVLTNIMVDDSFCYGYNTLVDGYHKSKIHPLFKRIKLVSN